MPIIRKQLKPADVYPETMRYNDLTDEFESLIDDVWTPNPEGDPRHQTLFPPRLTTDPRCDAAASVRTAFEGQISGILTAIDNGATAFAIAGTILGLFAFGPFGVFISLALFLADQMLSAGTTALEAALTEAAWDDFQCILYCRMNDQGRLSADGMDIVQGQIATDIGGLAAAIMNGMLNLAGEGGVNNIAAQGTATGDCSECDCGECETEYFTDNLGGGDNRGEFLGVFDGYQRWRSTNGGTATQAIFLNSLSAGACCELLDFRVIENPDNLAATYWIPCGNDQTGGNLVSNWGLGICANFLAAQTPTDSNIPFTIEFLFVAC